MKTIDPSPLSTAAHKITLRFNGQNLSVATAFFYQHAESNWLVTNWHNLSGRNPLTGKPLSVSTGAIPNELVLHAAEWGHDGDKTFLHWSERVIGLLDDAGDPKWKVHPEFRERVDIAVMEFKKISDSLRVANNEKLLNLSKFKVRAGMDAFVLGYPLGISGGAKFPIWKRASIASEPDIDVDSLPKIVIDTATREGMSGSPVYVRNTGWWLPEGESGIKNHVIGEGTKFIGIYSGRVLGEDLLSAQLGIVWKETALIEIIESNCYDLVRE